MFNSFLFIQVICHYAKHWDLEFATIFATIFATRLGNMPLGPALAGLGRAGPGRAPQAASGCLGLANFLPPAVASPTRRAAVDGATSQPAGRQSGPARPASVRCGPAWRAPIRSGLVPSGPDRSSPVRSSLVRLGPAWAPFGQRAVASPTCRPPAPSVELLASGPAD